MNYELKQNQFFKKKFLCSIFFFLIHMFETNITKNIMHNGV